MEPACSKVVLTCILTVILASAGVGGKRKQAHCSVCKDIVKGFHKGLESTAKSNYGGGNTNWEEKSLGSYATSEVRLVEIHDHLCRETSSKDQCHSMVEEHEDLIERFWFKEFAQKKDTIFFTYICIEHMKVCCPNNTFGKECSPCPGGIETPCHGNGNCEGEGTRDGSGKCKCHSGYQGELCNECKDGFYEDEEDNDETRASCKACHIACKNTCSEGGPKGCDECKTGWSEDVEEGCKDINECAEDPCEENQYCTNTLGSFSCFTCDVACLTCTGAGRTKCNECNAGFTYNEENICEDINECEVESNLCTRDHETCQNTPGSYECVCVQGFQKREGICVPISKEDIDVDETSKTSDDIKKEEL